MSDQRQDPSEPRGADDAKITPRTSEEAQAKMDAGVSARPGMELPPELAPMDPETERKRHELHVRIENDFRYHAPPDPATTEAYHKIRSMARHYAHELVDMVPPGRELAQALSALELVTFHANAGVARNP